MGGSGWRLRIEYEYDGEGRLDGSWTSHAFYHADGGGNVTFLSPSTYSGTLTRYSYDAYGRSTSANGPLATANVYRFSSKELHAASGHYYYGYRFYDPQAQRWINRDPLGEAGGVNLYGFVHNNPTDSMDPFGLDVVYLLDPQAVSGQGHAAVLIGNDQDGWNYFSFGLGTCQVNPYGGNDDNLDVKGFKSFSDARKDAELARYKRYARWKSDKAADRKALNKAREFSGKNYNIFSRNCDDMAADAIKAAGKRFKDKWRPVKAYEVNKDNADESGDFPQQPKPQFP